MWAGMHVSMHKCTYACLSVVHTVVHNYADTSFMHNIPYMIALERWLSEAGDFMSESTIMAYFDHPNVLRMIGLSVDTDIFSIDIVLPYMINGDLRAFLKGQRVEQGNISSYPEVCSKTSIPELLYFTCIPACL